MRWRRKKSENNFENWTRERILERLIISESFWVFFWAPFHVFHFASHRWSIESVGCAKYRMRIKKVKDSRNVFLLQTYTHTGSCALLFFSYWKISILFVTQVAPCIYGHRFHFSFLYSFSIIFLERWKWKFLCWFFFLLTKFILFYLILVFYARIAWFRVDGLGRVLRR